MSDSELFDEMVWDAWTEEEETQAEHAAFNAQARYIAHRNAGLTEG